LLIMPEPHIRYDLLAQQALRGVVRTVLADVAKKGLPGDHHFKISFSTTAPGVRLSDRLLAQYPETMTIVLQHQFWDLSVGERAFEVGLSFGGISERLTVPFDSIIAFYDPAVQFGFQFESVDEAAARGESDKVADDAKDKGAEKSSAPAPRALPAGKGAAAKPATKPIAKPVAKPEATPAETPPPGPDGASGGGEVVRLDRFRKK
jgi:hypothetical protein